MFYEVGKEWDGEIIFDDIFSIELGDFGMVVFF